MEIQSDLSAKGFKNDTISQVINELLNRNLLDDEALARDVVLSGQRMNRGRSRIYADLRKRGLARNLAEESLAEFYSDEMERESIIHLIEKSKIIASPSLDESQLNKITRKISGKGFPPWLARDLLREMTCDEGEHKGDEFP